MKIKNFAYIPDYFIKVLIEYQVLVVHNVLHVTLRATILKCILLAERIRDEPFLRFEVSFSTNLLRV